MATEKIVDRFDVMDSKGKIRGVFVYQEFVDTYTLSEPNDESPGLQRLVITDSRLGELKVDQIDDHTFKIRKTGEILRKV